MKTLMTVFVCTCLLAPVAKAQQQGHPTEAQDAFEVASVKPAGPVPSGGGRGSDASGGIGGGCDGGFPQVEGNRFSVTTTAYALITWAYGYNKVWGCSFVSFGDLLTGGPGWISDLKFKRSCRKARLPIRWTNS